MSSVGLGDHRAGNAHALLFSGREFQRTIPFPAEQPHLIERRAHALVDFASGHPGDDQRQRDIVRDGAVVKQLVILKYHADPAAKLR